MMSLRWYEIVIGAILLTCLVIGGFALLCYTPQNVISRESVCLAPYDGGGLSAYWEKITDQSGIDPKTAQLGRLEAVTGPDGTFVTIELGFLASDGWSERYYQFTYRTTNGSCGWSDGLSYSSQPHAIPPTLPVSPEDFFSRIGQIRFADMGLAGRSVAVWTLPADSFPPEEVFVLKNGSLVHLPLPDNRTLLPVVLLVAEKRCTAKPDGSRLCITLTPARVFLAQPG